MADEQAGEQPVATSAVWPYHLARTRDRTKAPTSAPAAPPHPPDDLPAHPWGVCLSGGGVRSASFCLGALQAMQRRHMLIGDERQRATYLSAVSGGSYIAGAYTVLARQLEGGADGTTAPGAPPPPAPGVDPYARPVPPAPGAPHLTSPVSPEECYLQDHTLYLPNGPGGSLGAMWHLTLGIIWNLIVLNLPIFVAGTLVGWGARWAYNYRRDSSLFAFGNVQQGIQTPSSRWVILAVLAGAALLVGLFALMGAYAPKAPVIERASRWLVVLTGVWLAFIGLPYVLAGVGWLLHHLSVIGAAGATTAGATGVAAGAVSGTVTTTAGAAVTTTAAPTVGQTAGGLGAVASAGGLLSLGTAMTLARRLWSPKVRSGAGSKAWTFVNKHRGASLNLAASLAGPLMIGGVFLLAATVGAAAAAAGGSQWRNNALAAGVALAVIAVAWAVADLNAWSPHSYYYQRLASVYAIGRKRVAGEDPRLYGHYDDSAIVRMPGGPGDPPAVPVTALPWKLDDADLRLSSFQPDRFPEVLICACATVSDYGSIPTGFNATSFVFSQKVIGGPLVGAVPTATYLERLGPSAVNLPEAVSIAGAAVAPEMGKMTRKPLRFFITLANLRLGVWIINPRIVEASSPNKRRPRLPRIQYLFREMFGRNHLDLPYLYVSDGGHYENLGLVEQLRRGCEWVFCIDAAGDSVTTFHTVGEALALARSELGIDVELHPESDMVPAQDQDDAGPPHHPWVTQAHCLGTIHYPDRPAGHLVYVKAGVPADAPWDVKNYAEEHTLFPTDPTSDQLFDAERVEAYRALGEFVTERALTACEGEFTKFLEDR